MSLIGKINKRVIVLQVIIMRLVHITYSQNENSNIQSQVAAAPKGEISDAELAQKILNPVAAMGSVPFIFLGDYNIGPDNGNRTTLSMQPVIPFEINPKLNLITRTLIPVLSQKNIPEGETAFGIGDILATAYLSPVKPWKGWITGLGCGLLMPTASEIDIASKKWSLGPSILALRLKGGWTYGGLVTQTWSFAGNEEYKDINSMFVQPFIGYTNPAGWNYTVWTESTVSWNRESGDKNATQLYFTLAKVVRFGKQRVQLEAGPNYWIADTEVSPSGLGWRANFVLLFPK